MTYGYRLNMEQLQYKQANEAWAKAQLLMVNVKGNDPISDKEITIIAPNFEDETCVTLCIQAAISWSISVESFTNLCVRSYEPTSSVNELDSTLNKIKKIFQTVKMPVGNFTWYHDLDALFKLRNKLVHFKEQIKYQGFCYLPDYQIDFSSVQMSKYQNSVISVIKEIAIITQNDASFIDSNTYNLFINNE